MSKNFELLRRVAKEDCFNVSDDSVRAAQKALSAVPCKKVAPDAEITKLVQRLFSRAGQGSGPKVVSFTAISPGERSKWICARAGEALSKQVEASVCVVHANLWSPPLPVPFAAAHQVGFADALDRNGPIRTFATPLGEPNLWLIPSGSVKAGVYPPMERVRERFTELREAFDYLLISTPAFSHETEATFLGQLADGVVLIVEAHQSRRETVRRAKEQLESAGVRILGAVLDQRTFPIPEKLYRRL